METKRFILLIFVSHFILFYSIFDVYFTSPINHGMPVHRSTSTPRAKRLVLFVADGLRSDKLFNSLNNTPFLQSVIQNRLSLSGISHTRVPTESRPGHVAIISGFYEDVSAVTRGWKESPMEFDSVFNRSHYTFGFGSPDIVPMFKRGQSYEHFYVDCYKSNDEEFGNDRAHELDLWVERQFENFLRNRSHVKELQQDQIVFFFHLLGIDTNGHSHKPWSEIYMKNIQIVDGIVQRLEKLIEDYYNNDQKTTYLFTSDHGMTDWGSHGAGDDSETLTPLVIWGSAIRTSRHQSVEVEQADLCPTMSFFLALDYPVNSVGRLPIDYLLPIDEEILQAYVQNARQLLEQVHQQHNQLKQRLLFFRPFPLNEEKFFHRLETGEGFANVYQIKEGITTFMQEIAEASRYYHDYRRFLLSLLIAMGFLMLISTIFFQLNPIRTRSSSIGWGWKIISLLVLILFIVEQSPWTHLLYPLLVCLHTWLSADFVITWFDQEGKTLIKSISFWSNAIFLAVLLQTYILPFFYRWSMSVGVIWLLLDAIRRWHGSFLHDRRRGAYGLFLVLIFIFPFLPSLGSVKSNSAIWCTFIAGLMSILFYYLYFFRNSRSSRLHLVQFMCLLLAVIDNLLVHYFEQRSNWIHLISWMILIISCCLPLFSPSTERLKRLIVIFSSIMTIYLLLSTQYESLFVLVLCGLMSTWILTSDREHQRLSFFTCQAFLFILLAFFGTGNFASINSFDPSTVYCFLTIFNPFLMSTMILLKCILPIFIVNCATSFVIRDRQILRDFRLYSLILCDSLALELFFTIRTVGSWLEIGESISRYVILMTMIVILLIFQSLASLLLTKELRLSFL